MSLILSMVIGGLVYFGSFHYFSALVPSSAWLYKSISSSLLMGIASLGSGFFITGTIGDIFRRTINKKSFFQSAVILGIVVVCFYFSGKYNYINADGITEKSAFHTVHYSLADVKKSVINNKRVRLKNRLYMVLVDEFALKNGKVYRYTLDNEKSLQQAIRLAKVLPPTVSREVTKSSVDQLSDSINAYDFNQNEKKLAEALFTLYPEN